MQKKKVVYGASSAEMGWQAKGSEMGQFYLEWMMFEVLMGLVQKWGLETGCGKLVRGGESGSPKPIVLRGRGKYHGVTR